jgi:hypothetical protein
MKDHKGAQYAMEMANQVWRKPGVIGSVSRPSTRSVKVPPALAKKLPAFPSPTIASTVTAAHGSGQLSGFAYDQSSASSDTQSAQKTSSLEGFDPKRFPEDNRTVVLATSVEGSAGHLLSSMLGNEPKLPEFFGGMQTLNLSQATIPKIAAFLSDQERRNSRLVCKSWASMLKDE